MNGRKFPRVNYRCRILICKNGEEKIFDANTENIGQGGVCVSLPNDVGMFERVGVELFLGEGGSPVKCKGKVVWVVKGHGSAVGGEVAYDTGVEFTDLDRKDRERIEGLINGLLGPGT
ncbi:MAG: PilZ domain-containing protein [Candidatus Omnitrophota bacterium]